jgi:hypothetical protein
VARRVLISPAYLIGLIERNKALFAFAKERGSIDHDDHLRQPRNVRGGGPGVLRDQFPAHQAQHQRRPFETAEPMRA